MYGNRYLWSIKSMAAAIMVCFTAASPVVLGILIDIGVSMEALAMGSAVYVAITSGMAFYGFLLTRRRYALVAG